MFLDRTDAGNYGPLLIRRPPPGSTAKNIFMGEGLIDRFTPVPSIEALATSIGVDVLTPVSQSIPGVTLAGRGEVSPPVENNLGEVTAVVAQYDEVAGSDGHFVLFEVPAAITQSIGFLESLASTGTATVVAP
jgi:hypothetical protein